MPTIKISNDEISQINNTGGQDFPKYTTQLMNLANQNAQGTRPRVVGQLSELFPEYLNSTETPSVEGWREWYIKRYPDAIETATKKIVEQVMHLKAALPLIDEDMVRNWVEDLVINKTFNGLYYQKAILKAISEREQLPYRLATIYEEAQGIDGYVGDVAYSIKPDTYQYMNRLNESITVKIVTYTKQKNGISITY